MSDTQDITSADVAPVRTGRQELERFNDHLKSLTVDDPEKVRERIIANILGADNAADLLTAGASIPAETIDGVPIIVTAIRADESTLEDGPDLYLHVDASYASNGRTFTFSTSSGDIVAKLVKADMEGWFPLRCMVEKSTKRTAAGYYPMFLRPIDEDNEPF